MELQFDWLSMATSLGRMAAAYVLALPIAWDREQHERSAGLRTFPLVAVSATAFTLLGTEMFPGEHEAQARVMEGLITGVGFIGAGAILREQGTVHGTATAASIWSTGALGAACAYSRFELAVTLSLINLFTLRALTGLKRMAKEGDRTS
jgi:putative Mg2+ transporter-C (MgtC) family protein